MDKKAVLHAAASLGDEGLPVVKKMIEHGADAEAVDRIGNTPLHVAASMTSAPAVIRAIASAGGDVNAARKGGQTPLHCAAHRFNVEVVMVLLEYGAKKAAKNDNGKTPEGVASRMLPVGNATSEDRRAK